MVRRVLVAYLVVLGAALLWGRVEAATVPARLPAGVTYGGGAYSVQGTAVGGAVAAASTVSVASGVAATLPVAYRLGELAGIAARTAIRANAVALGAQVVLDYLLPYGIKKCETSGWCSGGTPEQAPNGKPYPNAKNYWTSDGLHFADAVSACTNAARIGGASQGRQYVYAGIASETQTSVSCLVDWLDINPPRYGVNLGAVVNSGPGCASGHTLQVSTGLCLPPGYVPATPSGPASDADWAKVPTSMPDTVLTSVMQEGRGWLPATPEVSTQVQTVPMSSVYKDPTTGVSYRDYAYVTPNPTDPQTATLQVVKAEVNPATGNPVTDPSGNMPGSVKPEDPCAANPNRVGCMDKGDIPASPDLQASEKTITITPDSGWGSDSAACPADLTSTLRTGGLAVAFSFKPACDAADMFRPIVIAMAWVAAVLIALGVGRKGD